MEGGSVQDHLLLCGSGKGGSDPEHMGPRLGLGVLGAQSFPFCTVV